MEKVKKIQKEIRLTFNVANEDDKKLYERLTKFTQPSKIIKKILFDNIDKTDNTSAIDNELLKVLTKLSDKIDSLSIQKESEPINSKEIILTGDVSADDLNDIDI